MSGELKVRESSCRNGHVPERSYWQPRNTKSGGQWFCRDCIKENSARYRSRLDAIDRAARLDAHATANRIRNRWLKIEVIEGYGGKCACCGESDWRKLTIDHIDGSGHSFRKRRDGFGSSFYSRLKKAGFPRDNHQLLCWSCNAVKHYFPEDPCCSAE